MPTYAYACQSCGHSFEIRQSFSDDALTTCPECSGQLRKLFNNVGIVFKGSGFYRNDSRSSAGASSGGSDGSGSTGSSAGAASTSSPSSTSSSSSSGSGSSGGSSSSGSSSSGSSAA
ncbi:FmdB family transcriptional regulator [Kineococcus sp. T13]|uniref:FmdB family zinc ribbon protein n=1 Tax=Kineococcus vitellinus TaxID=2696565 RepID=UPI0014121B3F|nr:FmdB family transcriptional regulator [Kineococcus vitellinus]